MRILGETIVNRLQIFVEIRAGSIEFVDKTNARHFEIIRVAPVCFGLWFYSGNSIKYSNSPIEHTHGALHLNGKIDVSWGINQIHAVIFPVTGCGSSRDSDSTLAFLFHPVHGCGAVMNFTNFVFATCVKQHAFGNGCFSRINMCKDSKVTNFFKGVFSRHKGMKREKLRKKKQNLTCEVSKRAVCFGHFLNI